MTKKTECKIVKDLLPTYIDELTDKETNLFIENHIKNCSECEQALKDMQGEIKLEKINNLKKIDALKKVRNRYRKIIVISVLIVILIGILGLYLWNNYRIVTDENGKVSIERFTFDKRNISKNTNTIIKYKEEQEQGTIDGYRYITLILTVNEKNICVNTRVKEEGYIEDELENVYERAKLDENVAKVITNIEKIENGIIYNNNTKNGKSKEEIITYLERNIETIEIIEY